MLGNMVPVILLLVNVAALIWVRYDYTCKQDKLVLIKIQLSVGQRFYQQMKCSKKSKTDKWFLRDVLEFLNMHEVEPFKKERSKMLTKYNKLFSCEDFDSEDIEIDYAKVEDDFLCQLEMVIDVLKCKINCYEMKLSDYKWLEKRLDSLVTAILTLMGCYYLK